MIKKVIKKNRRLYAILKIMCSKKDNNELINRILDDNINQFHIQINNLGTDNRKKIVYLIKRSDEYEGFFALLRTSLYYLAFADRFNFVPYVLWSDRCSYYEIGGYEGRNNPFEYYFKQSENITLESVMNSYNIVYSKPQDVKVMSDFPLGTPYYYEERFISELGRLAKKYLNFQSSIEKKLKIDSDLILKNRKVLGIHYRGTDFKNNYDIHPKFIIPEDYFEKIDYVISEYNFEKIFIATDDIDALKAFERRYGSKIIYYKDTLRCTGNISVMCKKDERANNNFLKGYEVLRDAYTLSVLEGIITGISMVSIFSRVFKKKADKKYKIDIIIDKGINANSNKYISCI